MRLGVVFRRSDAGVGHCRRRIEHAQFETSREQPAHSFVHVRLREESVVNGADNRIWLCAHLVAIVSADNVHSSFENCGYAVLGVGRIVMSLKDVGYSAAVGHHIALEAPIMPEMFFEERGVRAGGLAVQSVVGAHHGLGVAFGDGGAECGEVSVFHIMARGYDVHCMARGFWTTVHGEMLRSGNYFNVVRIAALQTGDEGDPHAGGEVGILAVGFLSSAPAGITEY